jgi:hypothetical protein
MKPGERACALLDDGFARRVGQRDNWRRSR